MTIDLRSLSDDPHQALVLALHASRAATGEDSKSPQDTWAEVLRRFEMELIPHFGIEERFLLPAPERLAEDALVARTRSEHARLREIVRGDDGPVEARLSEFGALLRDHVRFEERILFPRIQEIVSATVLDAVAAACEKARNPPR